MAENVQTEVAPVVIPEVAPVEAEVAQEEAPAVAEVAAPAQEQAPAAAEVAAPASAQEQVPAPAAAEVAVPPAEAEEGSRKRPAEDAEAPPAKKPRITQATIKKFLRKGKLLEHQIFTWRDWEDIRDAEVGDVTFYGCKMKIELKNAAGEVVLKPKQSVRRVEWYTSKSIIIFYPTGSIAGSIICPLSIMPQVPLV